MAEKEYVLGTDVDELNRLRRQHELWVLQARDLWVRAGFRSDHKVLDLGCGPGFTTLELARYLGPKSRITAVDASDRFLKYLAARAKTEFPQAKIEVEESFIEKMDLAEKDFDAAYCRWLMIFVPDVLGALKAIRRHLKPGAVFALQEYVSYEAMQVCPEIPVMERVLAAIFKSWKDQGGNPNRGRELPNLLERAGFRVQELKPVARISRPNEPLWDWPTGFFENYLPRMVSQGYLSAADRAEFEAGWKNAMTEPGSFFLAPMVIDIIATAV